MNCSSFVPQKQFGALKGLIYNVNILTMVYRIISLDPRKSNYPNEEKMMDDARG